MLERLPRARPHRLANIARFAGCALLVVGAAGLTAVLLWRTARGHGESQLIDLKIFRRAGHDVLHGISPYPVPTVDAMRGKPVFVYPAPAALLFSALAVLPFSITWVAWLIAMGAAMVLALRLAGSTDWRVAAAWFLTPAMAQTFVIGSFAPLLALCAALVWRYRDRAAVTAPVLALAICLKLLLLPLVLWLAVTGRRRAAAATCAATALACAVGWAIAGLHSATQYPQLLSSLSAIEQRIGFSTTAAAISLGLGPTAAQAAAVLCAAALCGVGWLRARAGRRAGGILPLPGLRAGAVADRVDALPGHRGRRVRALPAAAERAVAAAARLLGGAEHAAARRPGVAAPVARHARRRSVAGASPGRPGGAAGRSPPCATNAVTRRVTGRRRASSPLLSWAP